MKKKLIIVLFLSITYYLFGATVTVVDSQNEYGGITEQYDLDPTEKDYEYYHTFFVFYNKYKITQKRHYLLSDSVQVQTGYISQEEIYKNNMIAEYRMQLTEEMSKQQGLTEIIEKINPDGSTERLGYSDGNKTAYMDPSSFMIKYPVYSLDFLNKEYFSGVEKSDNDENYYFSSKYFKGRSFVRFDKGVKQLNDLDKLLIKLYAKYMGNKDIPNLFTSKTVVYSEGKSYTVYLPDVLVPYIEDNMDCLLAYGLLGCNENLYLLAADFSKVVK